MRKFSTDESETGRKRPGADNDPRTHSSEVVVRETDELRLDFQRSLFLEMGFEALDAENRARLFLYYEMADQWCSLASRRN